MQQRRELVIAICAMKPDVKGMRSSSNSRGKAAGFENSASIRLLDNGIDRWSASGPQIEVRTLVKRAVPMRGLYRKYAVCYSFNVLKLSTYHTEDDATWQTYDGDCRSVQCVAPRVYLHSRT